MLSRNFADQKLFVFNLRYHKVAFLDSDIIIARDPRFIFGSCDVGEGKRHTICAVQDPEKEGGYFNNGVFVIHPHARHIEVMISFVSVALPHATQELVGTCVKLCLSKLIFSWVRGLVEAWCPVPSDLPSRLDERGLHESLDPASRGV